MRGISHQKITIIRVRKPVEQTLNEELQWFGAALGLFNLRDKDKSCFRVFIALLKCAKRQEAISSDQLAFELGLSRGTIIHHINKLIRAGIVVEEGKRYILRVNSLQQLVDEIQKDAERAFNDLREIAKELDRGLGY